MSFIHQIEQQKLLKKQVLDKLVLYPPDVKHISKLQCMDRICFLSESSYEKYQRLLEDIQDSSYEEIEKLGLILSASALFYTFPSIYEKDVDELMMLTAASYDLDMDEYPFYIGVLKEKSICSKIVRSSADLFEQLELAYQVMDAQDEAFPYSECPNQEMLGDHAKRILSYLTVEQESAATLEKDSTVSEDSYCKKKILPHKNLS